MKTTNKNGQGTLAKEEKKKTTKTSASPSGNARCGDPAPHRAPDASGEGTPSAGRVKSRGVSQDPTAQQEAWFTEWWAAYWRRSAKADARVAFGNCVKTEKLFQEIMAATRAQSSEMLAKEERYRPHGATWLNGRRWEDETIPAGQGPTADDYPEL